MHVVRYAHKIKLLIQLPDAWNRELETADGKSPRRRLCVAIHKKSSNDKRHNKKNTVVGEEGAYPQHNFCNKGKLLARVGENLPYFGDDKRKHQHHDRDKSEHDECRIDQSVAGLGGKLVRAVYIVGQEE